MGKQTNSICTPSRASIITGQYPQTNGVLDLLGSIKPANQYLPLEMKKAGSKRTPGVVHTDLRIWG